MPIGVAREPSFSAIRGLPATTLAARKMATSDANGGLWSRPCHVREAGRSCRSSAARSTCCSSARDRVPRQRSASAAAAGVPRRRARSTIATARATLSALLNLPGIISRSQAWRFAQSGHGEQPFARGTDLQPIIMLRRAYPAIRPPAVEHADDRAKPFARQVELLMQLSVAAPEFLALSKSPRRIFKPPEELHRFPIDARLAAAIARLPLGRHARDPGGRPTVVRVGSKLRPNLCSVRQTKLRAANSCFNAG